MLEPSASLTIALRTDFVVPSYLPTRFVRGFWLIIFTDSTFTLKISSIA